jgi:hypothetical protein
MGFSAYPMDVSEATVKKLIGVDANNKTVNTKLDEHSSTLSTIESTTNNTNTNVSSIKADIEDSTHGLAALQAEHDVTQSKIDDVKTVVDDTNNVVDAIKTDTTNIETDTQDIQNKLVTLQAAVDSLQKDRSFYLHIDDKLQKPESGTTDYIITVNHLSSDGSPDNFDSAPTVKIVDNAGNDVSTTYLYNDAGTQTDTMDNPATGVYTLRFRVASDSTAGGYIIEVTAVEGGVTKQLFQGTHIVNEIYDSFGQSDRDTLNNIKSDTTQIISDVANVKTVVDSNANKLDEIEGAGFDTNTDSLHAIAQAIASQTANSEIGIARKQSGQISQGNYEVVELTSADGFSTSKAALNLFRVIPTTNTSSDYDVAIYEKSDNSSAIPLAEFKGISAAPTFWKEGEGLSVNLGNLLFFNQDDPVVNKIYVKITNNSDTSSSYFDIEIRYEKKA